MMSQHYRDHCTNSCKQVIVYLPDEIFAQSQGIEPKVHGKELIDNEEHTCFLGPLFTQWSVGLQINVHVSIHDTPR